MPQVCSSCLRSWVLRTQKLRTQSCHGCPLKAWSRLENSLVCFAHSHRFLPILMFTFRSIQFYDRKPLSLFPLAFRVGPRSKNRPSRLYAAEVDCRVECLRNIKLLQSDVSVKQTEHIFVNWFLNIFGLKMFLINCRPKYICAKWMLSSAYWLFCPGCRFPLDSVVSRTRIQHFICDLQFVFRTLTCTADVTQYYAFCRKETLVLVFKFLC